MPPARRWTTVTLAVLLAAAVAACSAQEGRPQAGASVTASGTASDGALDPCSLLTPEEIAEHSDIEADAPRWRGLSIKNARIVECRLGGPTRDTFTFGYVGYRPGRVQELLPSGTEVTEELPDIGDEAYLARERPSGAYWIAARKGSSQFLLVNSTYPATPSQKEDAVALARAAVGRLPVPVELGSIDLPPECEPADSTVITDILTKVELARGSTHENTLTCDYYGSGDTRMLIAAQELTRSNVDDLVESYRDDGFHEEVNGFPGAIVFREADGPAYSAFVDRTLDIGFRLEPRVGGEDDRLGRQASEQAGKALVQAFIQRVRDLN